MTRGVVVQKSSSCSSSIHTQNLLKPLKNHNYKKVIIIKNGLDLYVRLIGFKKNIV